MSKVSASQREHSRMVSRLLSQGYSPDEIVRMDDVYECVYKQDFSHYKVNVRANGARYLAFSFRELDL